MKEPKNIERLFQEKLKDLEMAPNPAVWNKIEQSMASPKKSKKGFIWWLSGTVAALFLIGFFLFTNKYFIKPETASKEIVKEKKSDSTYTEKNTLKKTESTLAKKAEKIKNTVENSTNKKNKIAETPPLQPKKNISTNPTLNQIEPSNKIANNTSKETPNISTNILNKDATTSISEKQNLAAVIEKENVISPLKKTKYWSIAPVVSELFYNTISNKSPVDSSLDNASKKGESSTSFGLKIAYQASKKWRIQTGIHKVDLAQTTENIAISSISRSSSFANSSQTVSTPNISNNEEITFIDSNADNEVRKTENNNKLRQSFGYIEIPVEINYQLFETNKMQFHLVGGVSSLFLTKNNLQIQNPNYSYSNGEATNLNDVNFSFNLGTAIEYHFTNRWFFNLSPMLKMQTQTFSNTDNKPYLLGVSTGINYKF
ncbi:outer membrane beta-barrel protein [Wenyingzhuangia sp. IMCC45467]